MYKIHHEDKPRDCNLQSAFSFMVDNMSVVMINIFSIQFLSFQACTNARAESLAKPLHVLGYRFDTGHGCSESLRWDSIYDEQHRGTRHTVVGVTGNVGDGTLR